MESENLEKQALAREFQLEKEKRDREFRIFQNKDIENVQLKLECLRAKQNTFVTSSQVPLFEETKYLIHTDQNSEQIELDKEEEKEVNSENKEILHHVGPCSRISPVTKINSSTLFAKQKNSEKLALINSEVSSKTDVDACEPMPASTEGNNKHTTIRRFASKYPDVIPVSDKTSKSVIQALLQSAFTSRRERLGSGSSTRERSVDICSRVLPLDERLYLAQSVSVRNDLAANVNNRIADDFYKSVNIVHIFVCCELSCVFGK
ncbi:hypothetical protein TNCV_1736681 [Trichonephila clavipes]|nr:hypothetical protein TNCV_1736681 [Trichonephila clavipes]